MTGNKYFGKTAGNREGNLCDNFISIAKNAMINLSEDFSSANANANAKTEQNTNGYLLTATVTYIDHILENILHYVDTPTLKECRLICRQWNFTGSTELEKRERVFIPVGIGYKQMILPGSATHGPPCTLSHSEFCNCFHSPSQHHPNDDQSLLDLIENSDCFPSTSFHVYTNTFVLPQITSFFSQMGSQIKRLDLNLCSVGNIAHSFYNSSIMPLFQQLLTEHLPLLNHLGIALNLPATLSWESEMDKWDASPAFKFFPDSLRKPGSYPLLPNLKSLDVRTRFPGKAIMEIIEEACNLKSFHGFISSQTTANPWTDYFLEGKGLDRIHLIKGLTLVLGIWTVPVIERLIFASSQYGKKIKLEKLDIKMWFSHCLLDTVFFMPDCIHRIREIVDKLFESSSNTLENLTLFQLGFLPGGNPIPIMKKVETVVFEPISKSITTCCSGSNHSFFPEGFNMATNFPFVKNIVVDDWIDIEIGEDFIHPLGIQEPVNSVTNFCCKNSHFYPSAININELIPNVFPNAVLCTV